MSTGLVAITKGGARLARQVAAATPGSRIFCSERCADEAGPTAEVFTGRVGDTLAAHFHEFDTWIAFVSLGAVVRLAAPALKGKDVDPAVVVVDEAARFAIAALSGHWGGANAEAERVAGILGAQPVITTASDANRTIAAEPVAPEGEALRAAVADLILGGRLFAGAKGETPLGEQIQEEIAAWDLYVALGHDDGETVEDPRPWLMARLESLGVEHSEDLALIEADDLGFDGIPAWERPRFDKYYPRWLNLEGMDARVHYEPRRKRITVEKTGGRRTSAPKRAELPAWSGWSIQFRDGSRLVPLGR